MPVVIRFILLPQSDVNMKLEHVPAQGWALSLIRRFDPAWSAMLHADGALWDAEEASGGYALSPLYRPSSEPLHQEDGSFIHALTSGRLRAATPVALRITLADGERAGLLLDALKHNPGLIPDLGGSPCRLLRVPTRATEDPDFLSASWEQIAFPPLADRLHIRFVSPTLFRRQGACYPLPDPVLLWQSWLSRWQPLAGFVPDGADLLSEALPRISAYRLETVPVRMKGGLIIGFLGELEMDMKHLPVAARRAATAVAGIGDFLGTGAKTTMGLGQTRLRIRPVA